jgi:hypothetical protein
MLHEELAILPQSALLLYDYILHSKHPYCMANQMTVSTEASHEWKTSCQIVTNQYSMLSFLLAVTLWLNKTGNVSDYKIKDVLVNCLFQSITCV